MTEKPSRLQDANEDKVQDAAESLLLCCRRARQERLYGKVVIELSFQNGSVQGFEETYKKSVR